MTPLHDREHWTLPPDGRPLEQQPQWRQDFPIDWPQDHYVARRDFTKFMVLTSFAFTVGQLWIGVQNFFRQRRGQLPITPITNVDNLAIGQSLVFNYPGAHDSCVLVRTGAEQFVAFDQKCTHLSCAVIPEPDKGRFLCPCHNGAFELQTGRPLQGPPRRPLPRITLEIRQGTLYATGREERTIA
jgi:Rieske Fe-S protein